MKEEYVEGAFETPTVSKEAIPEQLKSALGQAAGSLQQLPVPIKDTMASGLKLPLSGIFRRLFMISYLDEEMLVNLVLPIVMDANLLEIIRDSAGAPDVLTRLEGSPPPLADETIATKYGS